jgi:protein-disulfide isomerase
MDPTWGDRTAPVTIVEFADFECPFCARAEPVLARIRAMYGPSLVRVVWKNNPLPFHPNARPAAEAGAGVRALAGNEAFWRFHDLVLAAQSDLGEEAFVRWAVQAGVRDPDGFRAGLRSGRWAAAVDVDLAEATKLDASGTPWFFVNGIRIPGAQPYEAFRRVIDPQVVAARAKLAAGTPALRVYAELSKENVASSPDDDADAKTVYRVPVGSSPARGDAKALVTIVEFADYQCGFCSLAERTLRELRTSYGDKLRLVLKDEPLPFHPRAEPAAEAALEVRAEKGDDAFWKMHDLLLDNQHDLSDDSLVRFAVGLGAKGEKVRAAVKNHTHQIEIEADLRLAENLDARGTPHFFVNGRRLVGAQSKEAFTALIDEEMGKARALIQSGTTPEGVYDALTKGGKEGGTEGAVRRDEP